jgi:hypothetical protein
MRHSPSDFVQFSEPAVMRSSLRPIGLATLLVGVLLLTPVTVVFAEDGEVEDEVSDGTQIVPEGPAPYVPSAKNLNTVPEDGASVRSVQMQDSPWVKRILASRPNEDLVICIAGCYSGRDRVIYAQPTTIPPRTAQATVGDAKPSRSAAAEAGGATTASRTN